MNTKINPPLYIGLLSGTSIDGIDAALVDFTSSAELLEYYCHPIPEKTKTMLWDVIAQDNINDLRIMKLDKELGYLFAEATQILLDKAKVPIQNITAIGSHGQTISHHPNAKEPYTLQIANAQIIANETKITTVANFRAADIAAGGQGAPLAPLFHHAFLRSTTKNRAIVNIGGIANITLLNTADKKIIGFDTGPGNGLMDDWIKKHLGKEYDKNGQWAATGVVDEALLQRCLQDPYFQKSPPKSTGKDYFNLKWLDTHLHQYKPEDVQATLTELTAQSIINAVNEKCKDYELVVCGGGVHNKTLMHRLSKLSNNNVLSSVECHLNPDYLEAMLFAWLAKSRLKRQKLDTRSLTGAKHPILLGDIYLPELN